MAPVDKELQDSVPRRLIVEGERRAARHIQLLKDKKYQVESHRLSTEMESAYLRHKAVLDDFFRRVPLPFSAATRAKARSIVVELKVPRGIERLLYDWIDLCARYGVRLLPDTLTEEHIIQGKGKAGRRGAFVVELLARPSPWLGARVSKGRLLPLQVIGEDDDRFANLDLEQAPEIPDAMRKLVDAGALRYFEIDDPTGDSLLSEIEEASYESGTVTVIVHKRSVPFVFCLLGEATTTENWRAIERALTALRAQLYGRQNKGRPPDMDKRRRVSDLIGEPGSMKEKASQYREIGNDEPEPARRLANAQSSMSQMKRKITKQPQ